MGIEKQFANMGICTKISRPEPKLTVDVDTDSLEVFFETKRRLFGANMSCVYHTVLGLSGKGESYDSNHTVIHLKLIWKGRWHVKAQKSCNELGEKMIKLFEQDDELQCQVANSGVHSVGIFLNNNADQWWWETYLRPLAGTISVMFFPPVLPFEVNLRGDEIRAHYNILNKVHTILRSAV